MAMPKPRGQRRRNGADYERQRRRLLEEAGYRCSQCGRAGPLELHHVVEVEHGGDDSPGNLVVLCRPCHFAAHGRRPGPDRSEFRRELRRRLSE